MSENAKNRRVLLVVVFQSSFRVRLVTGSLKSSPEGLYVQVLQDFPPMLPHDPRDFLRAPKRLRGDHVACRNFQF